MASGVTPPLESTTLLAASFLIAAVLACRGGRILIATVLLLGGFFFLGACSRQLAEQTVERQPLRQFYESLGESHFDAPCFLDGALRAEPELGERTVKLQMSVRRLNVRGTTWPRAGNVSVNVRGEPEIRRSLADLEAGDRVSVWATLRRPRGFLNPGGFDVEAYLARKGVSMSGSVKSALLVERQDASSWLSPRKLGSRARGFVRVRIREAFHRIGAGDEVPGVVVALLTGDRSLMAPGAEKLYQEAGVFHVMVISGAHVALLAWLLYGVLRWSRCDQTPALIVLLLALPLYAALCGGRPSVVRAVTMCCSVVGAKLLSLEVPAVNGLAVSALLLLAFRPLDLYDPGFQLSFAATASIVALHGPLSRRLAARLGRLAHPVAISLAAQAAVVPILAWHFQRLTPAAVLASIVAMPLAAGSLIAGALLLIVAPLPWLGEGLAWLVWIQVKALTLCSQVATALPGGSLRVPQPGWLWMCGYLVMFVALVASSGRLRRSVAVLMCIAALGLTLEPRRSESSLLRLTALDVGHGDALLLELPDGKRLLVDGGGSFDRSFDVGERVVVPALLRRGVRSLDAVVLTHADFDHIGGLPAVVSNLKVRELWQGRPAWRLPIYRDLRERARRHGMRVRRLRHGEEIQLGDVTVEVLAAGDSEDGPTLPRNNDSLVLRLRYGRSRILLTGDAEQELEQELIRSGKLRADVLKVGHHGSRSSTGAAFLEAVRPRLAVVSTGASGSFHLPSARVLHRLRARGVTCLRTDLDGAVSVGLDRRGRVQVETFKARP
jgi:competence protein ComEC